MSIRKLSPMLVMATALVAGPIASPLFAASLPPPVRGVVRFEPDVGPPIAAPPFQLAAHEFAFRQTFRPSDAPNLELSDIEFPSPVRTDFECNNTVHCEYFRPHEAGRRPAVVVLHILGGDFPLARLFCRSLAARGTAALFVKMPYYGPRRPVGVRKRMISEDPRETVAGMTQAVLDVRRATAWLAARDEIDPQRLGIFGISLGGITAALAASQEPRLTNVCLMPAGGELSRALSQTGEGSAARRKWIAAGRTGEQFDDLLRSVDPAAYAAPVAGRRVLLINAAHDEVIPPACTESLREKLGRPPIVWYDAGHYSAVRFLFDGLYEATRFFRGVDRPHMPE